MNLSKEDTESHHGTSVALWDIMLSSFYILIFIIAIPGNALALWAFHHQKSTSPSKIFLKNLSIADISYVLILPMRIVYHLSKGHWSFGHILCQLSGFLFYLNMYCSLYLMSFISLDRLLVVVLPLRSQSVRKPLYAKIAVGILWILVITSMSPTLFSKKDNTNSSRTCNKMYLEKTSHTALISTIVAFLIPLTTIVISYIIILFKLRKLKQQEERPVRHKAIKMIILIVLNFLLAFVPYHVNRIIYIQRQFTATNGELETLRITNQITSALTCISGVLDPVIYFFLTRAYRDTFLKLFCKNHEFGQ